jgi:glycosyltransferase involved in cell wall biosynthesis/CDP-glycerol glycerophosphotransferase (TagB/SpsB family)
MTSAEAPRFSLVSAVYGVAGFLDDFIASIERQTFPLDRVQVVMVDDGSVDGSAEILQQWASRRPELVTVLSQGNAGQAVARNVGIEHARGQWVSFPDPDDAVSEDYLENVDRFIREHDEVDLVATSRLIWNVATGEVSNTHPLRYMFQRDRLVDLDADGHHFQGSAPAAFFRRDRLERESIRFDGRIRPAFEDGHFTSVYLLSCEQPKVGFLKSAQYHYRKREDRSSTLQTSRAHPGRYAEMLEHGYLDVVRTALERHGKLPSWLQAYLGWELSGYFTLTDPQMPGPVPTEGPAAEHVHTSIRRILRHLDLENAVARAMAPLARVSRYVLQHGYAEEPWHEPFVLFTELDREQRLVQATYFFTGDQPDEEVLEEGSATPPLHAKTVEFSYCGRILLRRRVLWVPAHRKTGLRLDGQDMPVVFERPPFPITVATPGAMRFQIGERSGRARNKASAFLPREPTTKEGRKALESYSRPKVVRRYQHAWVLMDRIHDAADSGEILFKHLREQHDDVNAWFVLEEGTTDWKRLRSEGYADRLVAHGSMQWRLLMAHAVHLISSHADEAITSPPAILEFIRPGWRYTFLNHGVIKDDLSGWLNRKNIDTFVTSTHQELASIAGDSSYRFSTREVQLTGMPRFDRLHEVGQRFGADRRDLLLVAPTWRSGLVPNLELGSQRRRLDAESISGSEFMQNWRTFLSDERLRVAADQHGVRVGFLPHPNLQPVLNRLELPDHVVLLSYDGVDVQELFARARVFVTDFSSVAFNQAFLERPVVYFQFDEESVLGGGHVGRAGYFDYRRDGFGPVTTTAPEAVGAVVAALDHGATPMDPYRSRIDTTFPERDGRSCERVVAAIRRSTRNRSQDEPEPTPVLGAAPAPASSSARDLDPVPPGKTP